MPNDNQNKPQEALQQNQGKPTSGPSVPPVIPDITPPPPPEPGGMPIPPVNQPKSGEKKWGKQKEKKEIKPGGRRKGKMIATILGLFLLVGGVASGAILVQKQQDIREHAAFDNADTGTGGTTGGGPAVDTCAWYGGDCVDSSYTCQEDYGPVDCGTGNKCGWSCDPPNAGSLCNTGTCKSSCTAPGEHDTGHLNCPGTQRCCQGGGSTGQACPSTSCDIPGTVPGAVQCNKNGSTIHCCPTDKPYYNVTQQKCQASLFPSECSDSVRQGILNNNKFTSANIDSNLYTTQDMKSYCETACGGTLYAVRYKCNSSTMPAGGCNSNGTEISKTGNAYKFDTNYTCGAQQIDIGCRNQANTYGTLAWMSEVQWPASCGTAPTGGTSDNGGTNNGTQTPNPSNPSSCQCTEVIVMDANNNKLSSDDLKNLKAGDIIKFGVKGTSSGEGSIDKARFIINGETSRTLSKERDRAGGNYYVLRYVIPEGLTELKVQAQLYHSVLGWI